MGLNYRGTVKCFAVVDGIATAFELYVAFDRVGVVGLLLLFGPIMGYTGADQLDRGKVCGYVVFCCIKLFGQIFVAVMTGGLLITLIAFLEMWITKIVVSFYNALRAIPPHRKLALRHAEVAAEDDVAAKSRTKPRKVGKKEQVAPFPDPKQGQTMSGV